MRRESTIANKFSEATLTDTKSRLFFGYISASVMQRSVRFVSGKLLTYRSPNWSQFSSLRSFSSLNSILELHFNWQLYWIRYDITDNITALFLGLCRHLIWIYLSQALKATEQRHIWSTIGWLLSFIGLFAFRNRIAVTLTFICMAPSTGFAVHDIAYNILHSII